MDTDEGVIGENQNIVTAAVAEWLRAWHTLTMFEATVCGRRNFFSRRVPTESLSSLVG